MDIIQKVGHRVIKQGDVLKSPSGGKDWVVVKAPTMHDTSIKLASVHKYLNKSEKELEEWYIKKSE
jgi:hypothetical protein